MLPPALGGLRSRVPPVLGRSAPGSMEKINVVQFPARRQNYTTLNAMLSNRRICKNHIAHGHARARAPTSDTGRDGRPRPSAHRRADDAQNRPYRGSGRVLPMHLQNCTGARGSGALGASRDLHWVQVAACIGCKTKSAPNANCRVHPMHYPPYPKHGSGRSVGGKSHDAQVRVGN